MPRYLDDELSKIDDIAALLITARSLAKRFDDREMRPVITQITTAVSELSSVRDRKAN